MSVDVKWMVHYRFKNSWSLSASRSFRDVANLHNCLTMAELAFVNFNLITHLLREVTG